MHVRYDDHDEHDDDEHVGGREGMLEDRMPPAVWVGGANDPLREDEIDDEEQHDSGGHEDLSGDGD